MLRALLAFGLALGIASAPALAQTSYPIVNPSFEADPIANGTYNQLVPSGWSGSGLIFVSNPGSANLTIGAPDGENTLTLGSPGEASQDISGTFYPGSSYTLSLLAGSEIPAGSNHSFDISVFVNYALVAAETKTSPPNSGEFRRYTLGFTLPTGGPLVSSVTIRISREPGLGSDVEFDSISLVASPATYSNFAQSDRPFGSAECQTAGAFVPQYTMDCEKFTAGGSVAGNAVIATSPVGGAYGGFPTHGNQWIESSNQNTGPLSGAPPLARVDKYFYAATRQVAFDWAMLTTEAIPSGSLYRDQAHWALYDFTGGTAVLVDFGTLADTNDTVNNAWGAAPNNYTSPFAGAFGSMTSGTKVLEIPSTSIGHPMFISVDVVNGGDNGFPSSVFIDDYRYQNPSARPGSGDDLRLGSGTVTPASLSGGGDQDEKTVYIGDVVYFGVASDSLFGLPILLAAQLFPAGGALPTPIPTYDLWINVGALLLVNGTASTPLGYSAAIVPGGSVFGFSVPGGLIGSSLMVQAIVPYPAASNGVLATSEAHIINFL